MMTENAQNNSTLDQDAMTAENFDKSIQEIFNLMNSYEALVVEIQNEARNFRDDNQKLKRNLENVIEENRRLRNEVHIEDPVTQFRSNYIEVADKIINTLRNQLVLCYKEREMYENLYNKTVSVLENEIPKNSIAKIKSEHDMEVKQLKVELNECQIKGKKTTEINNALQRNLRILVKKLDSIQTENKELKEANNQLAEKLKTIEVDKEETEKLLMESNELNKNQMQKSQESFLKLQQTIKIAESAVAEVEQLLEEKRAMEEEHDNLARTIGSVMEKASEHVDKTIEDLKNKHKVEIEKLNNEIERLKQEVEHEKLKTTSALQQVKMLELKMNSIDTTNSYLGEDLKVAQKTLTDVDEKLQKLQTEILEEKESKKLCQYEVEKLRAIIENQKKIKEKWKVVILDITKNLEDKIKTLVLENQHLKTLNRTI